MLLLPDAGRLLRPTLVACAVAQALCTPAAAQGVAADRDLQTVTVTGNHVPLDPNLPTTSESRTAAQLRDQNTINVEDALKYLPDVTVRKRYIGDRNALIGGRSSANLQAPRSLVYADGYLLSQFLGQFNAPRWNMVTPQELARVDVLYGPFSALYPGNSIGTTVVMTTRQPQGFEAEATVQAFTQQFDDAGYSGRYSGRQAGARVADKLDALTWSVSLNRLDNRSHPMQYVTLQSPSPSAAPAIPVTGAVRGTDPSGRPWYLAGPNGSAIEDNRQEQARLKVGYRFAPGIHGETLLARWRNDGRRSGATLLRDHAGAPVHDGLVSIDGVTYAIPAGAFAPQHVDETHDMLGVKLATRFGSGWNMSAVGTRYDIARDHVRTAAGNPPAALAGGPGLLADGSGTGWRTLDLQSTWSPQGEGRHALAFGYHDNRYALESRTSRTADWRHGDAQARVSAFRGRTSLAAWFAQDTWKIAPGWRITTGLRHERWKAFGGQRATAAATVSYADREDTAVSPKLSVAWQAPGDWLLRASAGKGVRFPTVAELFQGAVAGNAIVNNDPFLRAETSWAKELTAEKEFLLARSRGTLRLSLFEDDVRDTIYSQTNITVVPNVTNLQNIDRVRTRGVEASSVWHDVGMRGLDVTANASWSRGRILANANNPTLVGKTWIRVPRVRANALVSWAPHAHWSGSVGVRHAGRQYGTLDNSDSNPGVYGGNSSYTLWDMKLRWRPQRRAELSLGIDNLADARHYAFHPLPGRTLAGELRVIY